MQVSLDFNYSGILVIQENNPLRNLNKDQFEIQKTKIIVNKIIGF